MIVLRSALKCTDARWVRMSGWGYRDRDSSLLVNRDEIGKDLHDLLGDIVVERLGLTLQMPPSAREEGNEGI